MYEASLAMAKTASSALDYWTMASVSVATLLAAFVGWWLNEIASSRRATKRDLDRAVAASSAALDAMSANELLTHDVLDAGSGSAERLASLRAGSHFEVAQTALLSVQVRHPASEVREAAARLARDLIWVKELTMDWYQQHLASLAASNGAGKGNGAPSQGRADEARVRALQHLNSLPQASRDPIVTKVTPTIGSAVKIRGRRYSEHRWRFGAIQAADLVVQFGAVRAASIEVKNARTIIATPPAQTGRVRVTVLRVKPSVALSRDDFVYPPPPIIEAIVPSCVPASRRTNVVIRGAHLISSAKIEFEGKKAKRPTFRPDNTSITVRTPKHDEGAAKLVISTVGGSAAAEFTYRWWDKPPFGWTADGGRLVEDPHAQETLQIIRGLKHAKASPIRIRLKLFRQHHHWGNWWWPWFPRRISTVIREAERVEQDKAEGGPPQTAG